MVEPDPAVRDGLQFATILRYELSLVPRWPLPSALVTHVVQAGLPGNIRAVAQRAEEVRTRLRSCHGFCACATTSAERCLTCKGKKSFFLGNLGALLCSGC